MLRFFIQREKMINARARAPMVIIRALVKRLR